MDVVVERLVNSTPSNFYNNFTVPELASVWLLMNVKASVTIGGKFEYEKGGKGVYTELRPFERIAFRWEQEDLAPGSDVGMDIVLIDHETIKIIIRQTGIPDEESCVRLEDFWEWMLDSLKHFLETGLPLNKSEWESKR